MISKEEFVDCINVLTNFDTYINECYEIGLDLLCSQRTEVVDLFSKCQELLINSLEIDDEDTKEFLNELINDFISNGDTSYIGKGGVKEIIDTADELYEHIRLFIK